MISIQIVSKGLIYDQWKEFEYHETLNAISNFFKASVTIGMDVNSTIPFSRGDELKLKIGNEVRLTGYIEDIYFDIHEQKSDIVIMGRSKTCDLVDSCIDLDTYEFSNISILKIASKICSQFGITVVDNIGASKTIVSKWNIIPTETAWECLERLSRKYGFLISGNSKGELVLGKSASLESKIDLTNETNIKRISGSSTYSNRFKKYRVYGQSRNQSDANFTAIDSSFSRNRLSVSLAEFCSTTNDCKSRSLWEKQINIQRSEDLKVTVSEWTQGSSDKTWATNTKVKIIFPYLSINSEYLLTGLIFRHSEGLGQESLLEFEDVDSFLI